MKYGEQPHLGIVTKVASRYWRRLPPQVAASVDIEDMISEILMKLVMVSHLYDPTRGGPSTFVWRIAENHCRVIVKRMCCLKHCPPTSVSWEDLPGFGALDGGQRFAEARTGVERLLECASTELRTAVQKFLLTREYRPWRPSLLSEIRGLTRRFGISYSDFLLVLREV